MCNFTEDCNIEGSVLKECIKKSFITGESDFCGCPPYFGWRGEDCNVPSAQQLVSRVFYVLAMLYCFLLWGWQVNLCYKAVVLVKAGSPRMWHMLALISLSFLSVCFLFAGLIFFSIDVYHSEGFFIREVKGFQHVASVYSLRGLYCFHLAIVPLFCTIFLSVLNWFYLLERTAGLVLNNNLNDEKRVVAFLWVTTPLAVVALPVILFQDNFLGVVSLGLFLFITNMLLYCRMRRKFLIPINNVLRTSTSDAKNMTTLRNSKRFIIMSSRRFIAHSTLCLLLAVGHTNSIVSHVIAPREHHIQPTQIWEFLFAFSILLKGTWSCVYLNRLLNNMRNHQLRNVTPQPTKSSFITK